MTEEAPKTGNANNKRRRNRQPGKNKNNAQVAAGGENSPAEIGGTLTATSGGDAAAQNGAGNRGKQRQRQNRNAKKGTQGESTCPSHEETAVAGSENKVSAGAEKKNQNNRRRNRNRRQKVARANPSQAPTTTTKDEPDIVVNPEIAGETKTLTPKERKQLKRRNQRLRKKQEREHGGKTSNESNGGTKAHETSEGDAKNNKKGNTESFDPASTLVRPSLRVHVASGSAKEYGKKLKHDDVIIVPEMFGEEGDLTVFNKLVEEIAQLQKDQVKGAEWTTWHQGAHMIAKDPKESKTFQEVVDKLCEYFHVKKDTIFTRLNWYKDSKDWKPFHHDAAALKQQQAKTQNITVGVSFGACRELAFLKAKGEGENRDACRIYFPQPNNGCFTFGRDVNINFKHAINALPESEQDGKGRISIILWGWTDDLIEEEGSPPMIGETGTETPAPPSAKEAKALERKKAQNKKRKAKRAAKQQEQAAGEANTGEQSALVDDTGPKPPTPSSAKDAKALERKKAQNEKRKAKRAADQLRKQQEKAAAQANTGNPHTTSNDTTPAGAQNESVLSQDEVVDA